MKRWTDRRRRGAPARAIIAGLMLVTLSTATAHAAPETVRFASADGTTLVGYVYAPDVRGRRPAVVLLHGRSGVYSSLKRGVQSAEALSARHRMWGTFWAERGYVALLVDSFGPRGFGEGFPRGSYSTRPAAVSEQAVRPLDAFGAVAYLAARSDVDAERIGVQGWSNGGMTVLSTIDRTRSDLAALRASTRIKAAIAQYPGCRTQRSQPGYALAMPLLMLVAGEDDEVSPEACRELADDLRAGNENLEFVLYEGAHHAYDDPGKTKQSHAPNRAAREDSMKRAAAFFARHLQRP